MPVHQSRSEDEIQHGTDGGSVLCESELYSELTWQLMVKHEIPSRCFMPLASFELMPFRDAGNGDFDYGLTIQVSHISMTLTDRIVFMGSTRRWSYNY
jgi:hypothetical protein